MNKPKISIPTARSGRKFSGAPTPASILLKNTYDEWYDAKHRIITEGETRMLNSLSVPDCPYCGSTEIINWGRTRDKVIRYRCKSCGRTFNPLTGTLFASHKIPISEWIEYLLHLFEFHSLKTSSTDNRNAVSTGKYWLVKVFELLSSYQDSISIGKKVWIDETFFTVVRREMKRSASGMKLREISRNVISVACGTDGVHSFFIDEHTSKPSKQSTWESYSGHIKPGTLIIHDGDNSHSVLIERIPRCTEEVHKSDEAKKNDRGDSPLQPIDNLHSLLKRFMREHIGFKREDLQGWLNLFAFIMNPPYSLEDKIIILLQMAVYHRKRVKYRDSIGKKRLK